MPSFDVEFEVVCSCGEGLCNQSEGTSSRNGLYVTVDPCEKCLEKARDEGYDEGHTKGYDEGYEEARKDFE